MPNVIAASLVLGVITSVAYAAPPPKWIFYGFGSDVKGDTTALFFDQAGMKHQAASHVQVWTKTLSTKKMDKLAELIVNTPKEGSPDYESSVSLTKSLVARVGSHEPLLYESVSSVQLNDNARATIMGYEAVANNGAVDPDTKVMYDVDCSNDMLRILYIVATRADGKTSTVDRPDAWQHIPPETNGSRFEALVCKAAP